MCLYSDWRPRHRSVHTVLLSCLATMLLLAGCVDDEDKGEEFTALEDVPLATDAAGTPANGEDGPTKTPTGTAMATGTPTAPGADGELVALGEELVMSQGCLGCHGAGVAPAFGAIGQQVALASGETVEVDEAYLRESIVQPNARIVEGYSAGIMPVNLAEQLTDREIEAIVQYIRSLG